MLVWLPKDRTEDELLKNRSFEYVTFSQLQLLSKYLTFFTY